MDVASMRYGRWHRGRRPRMMEGEGLGMKVSGGASGEEAIRLIFMLVHLKNLRTALCYAFRARHCLNTSHAASGNSIPLPGVDQSHCIPAF